MKIGDTLAGRFELRSTLGAAPGSGGREVFAAWDLRARREVAVKVFPPSKIGQEKSPGHGDANLKKLDALLVVASRVDHPVVILPRIHRSLSTAPFFVVGDKVAGEDLAALAARGPLPWQRALDIALACAEGLIAVTAVTGVAHRALKPGNIRITLDGEVRVLDFATAELGVLPVGPRGDGSVAEYRAPEQLEGAPGDTGSDIFTLGVLLFELMTGVHPYSAPTAYKAAYKLLTQQAAPRPSELAPASALPSQVEALLARALARDPADRFNKSITEMASHLALVRRSPGLLIRPRSGPAQPVQTEDTHQLAALPHPDDHTTIMRLPRPAPQIASPTPAHPAPTLALPVVADPAPTLALPAVASPVSERTEVLPGWQRPAEQTLAMPEAPARAALPLPTWQQPAEQTLAMPAEERPPPPRKAASAAHSVPVPNPTLALTLAPRPPRREHTPQLRSGLIWLNLLCALLIVLAIIALWPS